MLKRITTGAAALTALGALALGGSVVASAKPVNHHSARATHRVARSAADNPLEAPSSAIDPAGGPNDQSGDQSGPNDQTGGPDTGSATEAKSASETSTEAPSSETDGPGGPNVQSGDQTGPDTGSSSNG